jgi:alpha-galactosidase
VTETLLDEIDCGEDAAVYAEGWQSWSPTAWRPATGTGPRPATPTEAAMRFRPGRPPLQSGFQGEGLLIADPANGTPVRSYSIPAATDGVATIRAHLHGGRLRVTASAADAHTVSVAEAPDRQTALARFGEAFATGAGSTTIRPAPTAWCTWYRYFEAVTPADVLENLAAIEAHGLPVDVVQLDDGWQVELGDWSPNARFDDLAGLAEAVRATGRRAGIWLAPFLTTAGSRTAAQHPDWLVGDAGYNWGAGLRGLDLNRTDVREHLWQAFRWLAERGFDYFKLDFLYAGALARSASDPDGVQAYRAGLQLIRDAVGPDAYLLGCGAPLLPSVGLVDAMRVSSDTFHEDGRDGSVGLRGEAAVRARAWQHGRLWTNDADCVVLSPAFSLRGRWAEVVRQVGGLRSFSDRIAELDTWGLETARDLLAHPPGPRPFPATEAP